MKLGVRTAGDVTVLIPKGMYLGGPETDELEQKLDELIQGGTPKLLLNLGETSYLSSAPLAVLIKSLNACEAKGLKIKLCNLDKKMNLVLVITRLVMRFDTYETEEQALQAFKGPQPARATTPAA